MKKLLRLLPLIAILALQHEKANAQPTLTTGGAKMLDEWIDKDTKHKVIKLTRNGGSNLSFYFHNNPFIGNKMVYFGSKATGDEVSDLKRETISSTAAR